MYTYEKKILFSDIDYTSSMSVAALLNAMQDCININSESIGRGIDYMLEKKRTWFAVSWNIYVKKLPKVFDEIVIKTWPYDFKASMGYRNVIVTNKASEDIVCADSVWTLVDMETGHPVRVSPEDARGYDLEPRYDMPKLERKIRIPSETTEIDRILVRRSNVDYNGHMSNGEYIKLAIDYLPESFDVKQIKVEYKNQSKLGEELRIMNYKEGNSYGYIFVASASDDIKAVVLFV
ncbi:MAG: acyl-[acyl-carrier-protein] thioesterase [Wujia sp.]